MDLATPPLFHYDKCTAQDERHPKIFRDFAGVAMKFSKDLSREFKKELMNAIRLSVFLSTLVFGFLIFQNRTISSDELMANSPDELQKCTIESGGKRVPASEHSESTVPCK